MQLSNEKLIDLSHIETQATGYRCNDDDIDNNQSQSHSLNMATLVAEYECVNPSLLDR